MNAVREHSVSAVIVAAGEGRRMGTTLRKPWITLAGEPIVVHTLKRFAALDVTREIILVVHPEDLSRAEALRGAFRTLQVVAGGETRVESVRAGLKLVADDAELVAVQDGVRPLVDAETILRTCRAALATGAAVPVVPVLATLKEVRGDTVVRTVPREGLCEAQTPQVFRTAILRRAYAELTTGDVTDDAQAVERIGQAVAVVPGSVHNIKLTTPDDLRLAEVLLRRRAGETPG